jgi:hypothetical protein
MATVPPGTVLSRIHLDRYAVESFNPVEADVVFGGGRFDGTERDPYEYMYLGDTDATAVSETLLRDLPPRRGGGRFLPKVTWKGRQLSRVLVVNSLELISLRTAIDLGAVSADTNLVHCDADDYPATRRWAEWLRTQAPAAQGITWESKREPYASSYVLFGDRVAAADLAPDTGPLTVPCTFDSPAGIDWLKRHLVDYRVTVRA